MHHRHRYPIGGLLRCSLLALLAVGCAPQDLEPLPAEFRQDVTTADTITSSDATTDADGDSGLDSSDDPPDFQQVADVLTNACSDKFCHGEMPNGNYHLEGGADASLSAVQSALDGVKTSDDKPLIAPGSPDESAIVRRITGQDTRMPPEPNDPLPGEQVQTIREWIAAGASYE